MFSGGKLYVYVADKYLEYPPVGKRVLLLEKYHHDYVHIGS